VRIIGGAFLLEALLVAVLIPIGPPVLSINTWIAVVMIGVAVLSFAVSWLMFRRVPTRRALHGFLLGVVATAIYISLCAMGPGGIPAAVAIYGAPLYWLGQLLRIGFTTAGAMGR
jgi:hypothetical protein